MAPCHSYNQPICSNSIVNPSACSTKITKNPHHPSHVEASSVLLAMCLGNRQPRDFWVIQWSSTSWASWSFVVWFYDTFNWLFFQFDYFSYFIFIPSVLLRKSSKYHMTNPCFVGTKKSSCPIVKSEPKSWFRILPRCHKRNGSIARWQSSWERLRSWRKTWHSWHSWMPLIWVYGPVT